MPKPPPATLQYIRESLAYAPRTGDLTWTVPPRAGELAGHAHKHDGSIVVGILYKQYRAAHIAAYLHTGEWPTSRVRFRDKDPANLAWLNLSLHQLVMTPKAMYARTLRQRQKAEAEVARRMIEGHSTIPGVRFSHEHVIETDDERAARVKRGEPEPTGNWLACDPEQRNVVRGSFRTQDEAEKFQRLFFHAEQYLDEHPHPYLPERVGNQRAGSTSGLTLAQAHTMLCYDTEYGLFYWRLGTLRGHRADHLNTSRRPVVTFASRQYPAAMLAWFMTYREWPPRKSILYRDEDPRNVALGNMFIPDRIDRAKRIEPMQEATE